MAYSQKDQAEALQSLKRYRLRPNETVYTVLRHVSSSGMSRSIDIFIMRKNVPIQITWMVRTLLDYPHDNKHMGLKIGGAGMDMGFAIVYNLSSFLWPKGYKCGGANCNSNDHCNGENNEHHSNGGYALRHSWL